MVLKVQLEKQYINLRMSKVQQGIYVIQRRKHVILAVSSVTIVSQ